MPLEEDLLASAMESVKAVESGDAVRWRSSVAARQWSFPSLAAHPLDRIRDFGGEL